MAGVPIRVMCGQSDPFAAATRQFVTGVPDLVPADFSPDGDCAKLWVAWAAAQLAPPARALG